MSLRPWHRKLIKDTVKSAVPFRASLRRLKRRLSPYRSNPHNDDYALQQGGEILEMLARHKRDLGCVLELGTGWIPTIPLLFHRAGAKHLILTDMRRLLDEQTIGYASEFTGVPTDGFSYEYKCPFDPRTIPSESVDVIYSRAVLEHIGSGTLANLFAEFRRILRPDGVMCHFIDNSDHWEHFDKSISRINFLRYEDGLFWKFCCLQSYQNRLRHSDYLAMLRDAGFDVVEEHGETDEQTPKDARSLELATPFAGRDPDDLAVLTSKIVARPSAAA